MGRKDEKKWTREKPVFAFGSSEITHEKNKARDLRHTSWWRKKIASGVCHYCGKKHKPEELTMDHVIPLSRGGISERMNIVPACKECNNRKKYLLPSEWEEYLEKIKSAADSTDNIND